MAVNNTTVKISTGLDGIEVNELLLRPNPFSGRGLGDNEVVLTIKKKVDDDYDDDVCAEGDIPVHIVVDVDELLNAVDLIKRSHYDTPERDVKARCDQP